MIRRFLLLLVAMAAHLGLQAQLNSYKYIVVPLQFEAFKQMNHHQTSSTTKFYLEQYGLPVIYDNAKPREIMESPCMAAYVKLTDKSSMFATRVQLSIVDCEGKILVQSGEGRSKEKDYKESYRQAIEQASMAFSGLGYTYQPPKPATVPETKPAEPVAVAVPEPPAAAPPMEEAPIQDAPAAVSAPVSEATEAGEAMELWYAQQTENGYQVVDRTPSVRMQLIRTSQPQTFIALVDGSPKGMVYQSEGIWIHEYYQDGQLHKDALNLKF